MRPTRLEVNLNRFYHNINEIKKYTHKEIMPVIKANAYGTYINQRLDVLNHFKIVAVALVSEGIELRNLGYEGDILVLNQPANNEIEEIEKNHLTIGLSSMAFLKECIKKDVSFPIHLEIETGMNRTGINLFDLGDFIEVIKRSKLPITGIYSHFSSADTDDNYSRQQINTFQRALEVCMQKDIKFEYVHMSASNGLLLYDLPFTNIVRPGILMYGYESYKGCSKDISIKPICRLVSEITFIKTVPKGTKIGYNEQYTCEEETIVATIPIGYGDGLRRSQSKNGYVYIKDQKAKIIGNICMDSIMVDITDIPSTIGDEVIIWDDKNITLEEIAEECDTIHYEILSTISHRIPRIFKEEKE